MCCFIWCRGKFLVNGSTSGILSAVMAVCKEGDEIAVARNCHKSVYSALVFSGANPVYIMPERIEDATFLGEISLEQIQKTVTKQTKAVILTSPTYEGITSDIAAISNFVHQKGMVLIVDEAHGAHMNFHDFFLKQHYSNKQILSYRAYIKPYLVPRKQQFSMCKGIEWTDKN